MPYIANPLEGIPLVNTFITDQSLLGTTPATDDVLIIYDQSATALKQLTIAELQASVLVSPAFTGVPTAPTANAGTNTTQMATTAFVTTATTALNTVTEMTDVTITSIGANEVLKWSGSAWINQTLAEANILPVAGPTFTGVLTVGSAVLSETDLEQIDDLTAGTAVAAKALVVDANKDIGTIRNLTIDGVFTDGNYTFDTSGNVTGLGTIGSGAITSTGVITGTGFTVGSAVIAEAELEMLDGITAGTAAGSKAVVLDSLTNIAGIGTISSGAITSSGVVTGTGFTIGSAVIAEAELEMIDGITAGTAAASKAVVLDASTNITGIGTIGSGNITSSGTVQGTTITATTAFVPDASDGAALGTTALEFSDLFLADGAIIYFGDDQDVNLTHVVDTGLTTDKDFTVGDDLFISGGLIDLKTNSGSAGQIKFYCETGNAHAQTLQGQPHSATATNVLLLPTGGNSTLVSLVSTDTLTNKTLTAPTINGVVGGTTTSQTITTVTSTTTNAGTLAIAAGSIIDSSGAISFGDENITTTGTVTVGNLTVNGSTTTVDTATLSVEDPLIILASGNNAGDAVDIGLYGLHDTTGSQDIYAGLFRDASDSGKWKLFGSLQEAPTTTVNVSGTGYATGTLVANLEGNVTGDVTGALTGNASGTALTVTQAAQTAITSVGTLSELAVTGEVAAGSLDINGAADISGVLTMSGGTLDMSGEDVDNIRSATFIDEIDNGDSSTSDNIDWGAGQKQKSRLTGNCTFTFTAPDGPCNVMLKCTNDGTARTITWPSTVKWPASTAPTFTGTNNVRDVIAFYYDGTDYFGQATLAFPA